MEGPCGPPVFAVQVIGSIRSIMNNRNQLRISLRATMTAKMTIRTTRTMSR